MQSKLYFNMLDSCEEEIDALYKTIGANVRNIRKKNGVTQIDLALALGFKTVSSVAKAEICTERKHFNLEHLYKIAKILDIEMAELLEGVKIK
jgi:transcriptional regulator with XRE-family HTH domain